MFQYKQRRRQRDASAVVARFVCELTPPGGEQTMVEGLTYYRLANGQIVEHWGEMDTLGLLQQLGLIPAPGQ